MGFVRPELLLLLVPVGLVWWRARDRVAATQVVRLLVAALLVSTSKDPARLDAAWKFLKFITSGVGAAAVAETTGYMPPNKAANEIILKDFYERNPNNMTAVRQLPLLREWIAYPGDKGLAVTQVLYDAMEEMVLGEHDDMKKLQAELVEEISDMLPK